MKKKTKAFIWKEHNGEILAVILANSIAEAMQKIAQEPHNYEKGPWTHRSLEEAPRLIQ